MKKNRFLSRALLVAIVCSLAISLMYLSSRSSEEKALQELNVYYPFFPSKEIDPRHVFSVADQVISEYVFGFYAQESYKRGLVPVLADVNVDRRSKTINLNLKRQIKLSDGTPISSEYVCNAIESFFKGTLHAKLRSALRKIDCKGNEISIGLNYVPVNIDALFSTSDFSIYDESRLPIKGGDSIPTSGPYSLVSMDANKASLVRNPYYPKELVANSIERVNLHWGSTASEQFLKTIDTSVVNAFYAFGFLLEKESIGKIRNSGYIVEQFPSEWLAYLGFNSRISLEERIALGKVIDEIRPEIGSLELGQEAYSISPSDRDFGLNKSDYQATAGSLPIKSITRKLKIGIFSEYLNAPIFIAYRERLKSKLGSNIELVVFDRSNVRSIFSDNVDAFLMVLGITPADPLTHFAFLQDTQPIFGNMVDVDSLESLSMIEDSNKLSEELIGFEKKVLRNRLLIPLAHFPGVVAQAAKLKRREDLAWSWGIQAWTFQVP